MVLEEGGVALHPQPYHAVALQRQAVGAERIVATLDIAIGHKVAIAGTTNGALTASTLIKES